MRLLIVFTYSLLSITLNGCATDYSKQKDQQISAGEDLIAAYKRSQTAISPPSNRLNFGATEQGDVQLALNDTLLYLQSRQICDKRPTEKVLVYPNRIRRCVKALGSNCVQYEQTYRGEPQPQCLKTALLNNNCIAREDPNQPKVSYKYVDDCYRVAAPIDVQGQIALFAVPEGTSRAQVTSRGRVIGQISLSKEENFRRLTIVNEPRADECLALADSGGQVINVRPDIGNTEGHLFATPKLQAEKSVWSTKKRAATDLETVNKLKSQLEKDRQSVIQSGAWKGSACVAPAMRQLPPEPQVMTTEEATSQARAACVLTLSSQINRDFVAASIMAGQNYEFAEATRKYISRPASLNACTRGAYFSSNDLAAVRGESAKEGFRSGNDLGEALGGLIVGAINNASMTVTARQQLVVSMLNSCSSSIVSNCASPRLQWQNEVDKIRAEPQAALASCQRSLQDFQKTSTQLKSAEGAATQSQSLADAAKPLVNPTRISLSDAVCRTQ